MDKKLLVLLAFALFILSMPLLVKAQDNTPLWRDEMSYQSFDQLQAAGWTSEHPDGVSFGSNGVILDQTNGDTSIHYGGHFAAGIYNWKVKDASRWVNGDHCGNDISALTEKHTYAFSADGWYSNFVFYRDGSKVYTSEKGTFSESKGTTFTLSIVKIGDKINCYYNDELKYTYTESDSTSSQLTGVDAVSPWRGSSEYDYFEMSTSNGASTIPVQSDNLLSNPLVIGGIAGGALVGVGAAVYYFVIAGGGAAAGSAGAAAGASAGAGLSGNTVGETIAGNNIVNNGIQNSSPSGMGNIHSSDSNLVAQGDLHAGQHHSGITDEFGKPILNNDSQSLPPNQTKPHNQTQQNGNESSNDSGSDESTPSDVHVA
jgi:hypothetical protein